MTGLSAIKPRVDGSLEPTGLGAVQNSAVEKWSYVDVVGCYNVR